MNFERCIRGRIRPPRLVEFVIVGIPQELEDEAGVARVEVLRESEATNRQLKFARIWAGAVTYARTEDPTSLSLAKSASSTSGRISRDMVPRLLSETSPWSWTMLCTISRAAFLLAIAKSSPTNLP